MSETAAAPAISAADFLLKQIVNASDLSTLTPESRIAYYTEVCNAVGLNPLTKPFEFISLSGKTVLYAKKECTDQLRSLHNIDIQILERSVIEGVYVVTVKAVMKTSGIIRADESTGAVSLKYPLTHQVWKNKQKVTEPHPSAGKDIMGEDKANAMMKAETKAKRRVTLSIVGLGVLDESEIEGITEYPDASVAATPALQGPASKTNVMQPATPAATPPAAATTTSQIPPDSNEATAPASSVASPVAAAPVEEKKTAEPAAPANTETGELMPANRIKTFDAKMKATGIDEAKFVAKFGKPLAQMLKSQSAEIQAFLDGK